MDDVMLAEEAGEIVTPGTGDADVTTTAEDAEGEKGAAVAEQPAREQQSHEENRRYQAARQSGERQGFERAQAAINARIAAMGVPDPKRPGKTIETVEDFEEFAKGFTKKQLEARAAATGKTVTELQEDDRVRQAGKRALAEEAKGKTARERAEKDAQEMRELYPEVDVPALMKQTAFRKFCGSRFGRESLAGLYGDYLDIATEAQKAATEKSVARGARDTGSGGGTGGVKLTGAQRTALDDWNRDNPDMKMTEAEFARYRRE